ncbi:ankyrin repeat-containing protein BDA1-like [Rosa rugosa]|uniref:ankyrin repeat-containing protein BDA1-like n=1 Tax=Rosa rugosa TaxID=74645 RepID=UPI002B409594|nr:ankyrin repeat-containing protein BDA1-like [Rosa rugosa]
MEIRKDDDGDDTLRLYQASVEGSISSLNTLIQNDPLLLRRVSLTTLSETPLHVSALLGHLEFSKIILTHNPRLAKELDSSRRSPLHLASAEGHKELVQVLLFAFPDACLFPDQEGRIPLHYAAMRGRVEVVKELIRAKPQSITLEVLGRSGETSLHLCVKHNHLDCLKILVKEVGGNSDFLNSGTGSNASMTILRLAMMLRQIETITYLVSLPAISKNLVNNVVLDSLEYGPGDFRSLEIQQILMDACINKNEKGKYQQQVFSTTPPLPPPSQSTIVGERTNKTGLPRLWMKLMQRLNYDKGDHWLDEMRGMLMVVATMISTMTFQVAINPPGGVWQKYEERFTIGKFEYCTKELCYPGTAVLGYVWEELMREFIKCNTISFVAFLGVTILLISGFPLTNRICIWFLSMAMCIAITFAGLTYITGVFMVMPDCVAFWVDTEYRKSVSLVWIVLLAMVGAFHTFRFLTWLVNKVNSKFRGKSRANNGMSIVDG